MNRLITAPDRLADENCLMVFLAGGIQKCPDWQKDLSEHLMQPRWKIDVALINPRQAHFDTSDPLAGEKQIKWEFKYLNKMDMFTMFFYGPTESDQPICFYELGRYIEVMKNRFPVSWDRRIVVTVCRPFKRHQDVVLQTRLATYGMVEAVCCDDYEEAIDRHKRAVANGIRELI